MHASNPIGIFDSGYGGLTVMKEILQQLPQYDYLYLGDNARAPYGNRSFETVYRYTLQCVDWFFRQGCPLVILAYNTASAKALRSIQQNDLPKMSSGHNGSNRVLGVIRPTREIIGQFSKTKNIGILATAGTVASESYPIEIHKFFPDLKVYQEACPMWVPIVENNEYDKPGADYFVQKHIDRIMEKSKEIDTLLLACTHYPLLKEKIAKAAPKGMSIVSQGEIVAKSLAEYLSRHPGMEARISHGNSRIFYTTDSTEDFDNHASIFFGGEVRSKRVVLVE